MADAAANEKSGARSIAGLEYLYDVVGTVRGALGKLRAHACHCAAELDLQRNPRVSNPLAFAAQRSRTMSDADG